MNTLESIRQKLAGKKVYLLAAAAALGAIAAWASGEMDTGNCLRTVLEALGGVVLRALPTPSPVTKSN